MRSKIEPMTQLAVNDRAVHETAEPAVARQEGQQDQQDQQDQQVQASAVQPTSQRLTPGRRPLFRT